MTWEMGQRFFLIIKFSTAGTRRHVLLVRLIYFQKILYLQLRVFCIKRVHFYIRLYQYKYLWLLGHELRGERMNGGLIE